MEINAAKAKIEETFGNIAAELKKAGVLCRGALCFMDRDLEPCEEAESAELISGELTVYTEGIAEEDGYPLGIVIECNGGTVKDSVIEDEIAALAKEGDELAKLLSESDDPTAFIKRYSEERAEEARRLIEEFDKQMDVTKKVGIISLIIGVGGLLLFAILMMIFG